MSKMSELDIQVREMLQEGFSVAEISRLLGVPAEWVQDVEFDPESNGEFEFVEYVDGGPAGEFIAEEEDNE